MGMHKFIKTKIYLRKQSKKTDKCPKCGRPKDENNTIRNIMGTLECYCGIKYYGE